MSARALYRPLPEVPERLRHHDAELVAVARFLVAADGTAQVELIEPTSEPSLNRSLIATLRTWRFFPALEEGRPVASTIDLRIPISVR
ncbi:MAG: TonB family protein [Myxococcota bacterium]